MFLLLFFLVGALLLTAWWKGWGFFNKLSSAEKKIESSGCLDPDKSRNGEENCVCDNSRGFYPTYVNAETKDEISYLQCLSCPDELIEEVEYEGETIKVCNTVSKFGGSANPHIAPTFEHMDPELYTATAFIATQKDMAEAGLDLTLKEFEGGDMLWGCWQEHEKIVEGASSERYYTHYPLYNPNYLDDAYKYSCAPCPPGTIGGIRNSQDAMWQTCIMDDVAAACPLEGLGANAFIETLDSSGVYSELVIICEGENRYTDGWRLTQLEMAEQERDNIDPNQLEPKDNGRGTIGYQTIHDREVFGCWSRTEIPDENGLVEMFLSHYPVKNADIYECAECPLGTKGQISFGEMGDIMQTCVLHNPNICAGEPHYRTGVPTILSSGAYTTLRMNCDGDLLHEAIWLHSQEILKTHAKTCAGRFGEISHCDTAADEISFSENDITWNPTQGYRGAGVYGCWGDPDGIGYIPEVVGNGAECVRCPVGFRSVVELDGEDVWQRCIVIPGEETKACNSVDSGGSPSLASVNQYLPYSSLYINCSGDEEKEPNPDRNLDFQGYFLDDTELSKLAYVITQGQINGLPPEIDSSFTYTYEEFPYVLLSAIKIFGMGTVNGQSVNVYEALMRRPCYGQFEEEIQNIEGRSLPLACGPTEFFRYGPAIGEASVDEVSRIYLTIGTEGTTWRISSDAVVVNGNVNHPAQFGHLFTDIKEGETTFEHPIRDEPVPRTNGMGAFGWYDMTTSDAKNAEKMGALLAAYYSDLLSTDVNLIWTSAIKKYGEPEYEIRYTRNCHAEDFSPSGSLYLEQVGVGRRLDYCAEGEVVEEVVRITTNNTNKYWEIYDDTEILSVTIPDKQDLHDGHHISQMPAVRVVSLPRWYHENFETWSQIEELGLTAPKGSDYHFYITKPGGNEGFMSDFYGFTFLNPLITDGQPIYLTEDNVELVKHITAQNNNGMLRNQNPGTIIIYRQEKWYTVNYPPVGGSKAKNTPILMPEEPIQYTQREKPWFVKKDPPSVEAFLNSPLSWTLAPDTGEGYFTDVEEGNRMYDEWIEIDGVYVLTNEIGAIAHLLNNLTEAPPQIQGHEFSTENVPPRLEDHLFKIAILDYERQVRYGISAYRIITWPPSTLDPNEEQYKYDRVPSENEELFEPPPGVAPTGKLWYMKGVSDWVLIDRSLAPQIHRIRNPYLNPLGSNRFYAMDNENGAVQIVDSNGDPVHSADKKNRRVRFRTLERRERMVIY